MSEENGNGNGKKILVPFMGGKVVIKEGGSFQDNKTGNLVEYGPCVDLSAIVDSKKRVDPGTFKNMIEAVSKHPDAMKAVTALA
ncbi:hypothetical protein V7O62_02250 [Methanolobus sp. ZRKC2]|uniref:hypothetical protein n=1 Tax=Methanolobus sp. ZRKC2 TaxID=3125783 RepID=UPI00324D07EA